MPDELDEVSSRRPAGGFRSRAPLAASPAARRGLALCAVALGAGWSVSAGTLEPFAVVAGITTVALLVHQDVVNWPIGIVSSAIFTVVFVQAGLYADAALQVLYVLLGFYGWWYWLRPKRSGREEIRVGTASPSLRLGLAVLAAAATVALGVFLDTTTDSTVPYPDAWTTVASLVAQFLLTRKLIDTWPVWIFAVNLPYVALYLYKGLLLTMVLQFVYIALSAVAWSAWARVRRPRSVLAVP